MELAAVGEAYDTTTSALDAAKGQRVSLRRAMADLEDALGAPAGGRVVEWAAEVAAALEHVGQVWTLHIQVTEGPGGLYGEIMEIAPRLANRVERFKDDHAEITHAIQTALVRVHS